MDLKSDPPLPKPLSLVCSRSGGSGFSVVFKTSVNIFHGSSWHSEASPGQMGYWSSYKFWVHQKMSEHESNSESTFPVIPVTSDAVSCRSIIYYSMKVHWQLCNTSLINPMQPQEEELFQNHSECAGQRPPTYIKPLTGAVLFLSGRYSVFRAQRDSDGGQAELSCTIWQMLQMCSLVVDIKKAGVVAANLLTQCFSWTTRKQPIICIKFSLWSFDSSP